MPITTIIDPPLPGDAPEVFDAKAFAAWASLAALGGEINASSAEITTKVSQAAGSATAAANSANAADASKTAADASKTAAAASASTASTKAGEADASKTAAAASATTASNAATAADASKTAAAGSATTATTKAGEAAASATTASGAATTATTKAGEASNSATTASAAATTATTKAGEASASATTASNAATTATTKAGEASNSATTATTKAGEASASASAAEQAKLDAQAAAQQAAGGGEPTIIAGTTAQYWRGDKSWQTLDKAAVGLGNVNNTADANKPVSTAQQAALDTKVDKTTVGAANGVAPLGADSKIASTYLPSYVDDVLEYANAASLPATGETGKIYVTLDNNKIFRWSGSAYVEISGSPGSTDAVTEGATNLYHTPARAAAAAPVQSVAGKTGTVTLTNADVGLSNVNNTSDSAKPVSTAQQTAMDVISRGAYNTVSGGVIDLSLASGKFALAVNGAVTVSFSNAHATYREAVLIELTYTSGTVTWPASIAWKGGTPPTLTAGKKTWITLYRSSAGTQYVPAVSHEV